MSRRINHAVKEWPGGFGALCGSLSLNGSLLKLRAVTCADCLALGGGLDPADLRAKIQQANDAASNIFPKEVA